MNPSNNPHEMDKENNSPGESLPMPPPQRQQHPIMSPINGLEETGSFHGMLTAFNEKLDQVQMRNVKLEYLADVNKKKMELIETELDEEKMKREEQAAKIAQLESKLSKLEITLKGLAPLNELRLDERVTSLEKSINLALDAGSDAYKMIEYAEGVTTATMEEFDKLNARQSKLEEQLRRRGKVQRMTGDGRATTTTGLGEAPGLPLTPPPQTVPQFRRNNGMIDGSTGTSSGLNAGHGPGQSPCHVMAVPTIRIVSGAQATIQMTGSSPRPSTSWAVLQQQSIQQPSTRTSSRQQLPNQTRANSSQMTASGATGSRDLLKSIPGQGQGQSAQVSPGPGPAPSSSGNVGTPAVYNLREQENANFSRNRGRKPSEFGIQFAECKKCAKLFTSKRVLDEHSKEDSTCWWTSSTSRGGNNQHGIINADKKTDKFFCICDRTLGRPRAAFIQHYVYYRAERRFMCQPCNLLFLYKSNINCHMQTKGHKRNLLAWNANKGNGT